MCKVSPIMSRLRGPQIGALKNTKELLYSGEILFHVESKVFEKTKSL